MATSPAKVIAIDSAITNRIHVEAKNLCVEVVESNDQFSLYAPAGWTWPNGDSVRIGLSYTEALQTLNEPMSCDARTLTAEGRH